MTQLFIQLVQSVAGAVFTIVVLLLVAAIIGYLTAWFYAKSVYTPKIKALESDKAGLNTQIDGLKSDIRKQNDEKEKLNEKIAELETKMSAMNSGRYLVNKAKDGQNYFHLKSASDQTILKSEMYTTRAACNNGIESVRRNCDDDNKYERKESSDNRHYFNLKATNGQVIGTSDMYESKELMENAIESVKMVGKSTAVEDNIA
jgi:uncharacterized protein